MKKKILTSIVVTLAFISSTQAQTITGKVVDEQGLPMSYVTIRYAKLKNLNALQVKISDEKGLFTFKTDSIIPFRIEATEVGYSAAIESFSTMSSQDTLKLVLKKNEHMLSAVMVTAQKKLVTQKIDRVIMNLGGNALTTGKSSLEVLNMAPGVFVNNGTISINGKAGTRILVNGRLIQLSGDDLINYLNNLRAEDITSIEVLAHPPAEYEAQGTGGMLNIILKKQVSSGLNGSVSTGYIQGRYLGTNDAIRLNLKENKLSFYTGYNFNSLKSYENSLITRNYSSEISSFDEQANRILKDHGNRVTAGVSYDISKKQYVSIDYIGTFSSRVSFYNSNAQVAYLQPEQIVLNAGSFPNLTDTKYNNIGINYNLVVDPKGSTFQLLADYTNNSLTKNSVANSSFFNNVGTLLSDTSYRNSTPSYASIYTADARYTQVLKNKMSVSTGIKGSSTNIDNSANFQFLQQGDWRENSAQDYIYNYKERIVAGYVNVQGKIWETDFKLGLRSEYTHMSGDLVTSNVINERSYFNVFPSFFLNHAIDPKSGDYLTMYYGRRLDRPTYNNLNPYEFYIDSYSTGRGNPYLTPSYSNIYELGYLLRNKYSIKLSYQEDRDLVSQYIKVDDKNPLLWIYTYENYGKNTNWNLAVSLPMTITKWWETNTNLEFSEQHLTTPDVNIQKGIAYLQTVHDFKLSQKINISFNAFYVSNIITGNFLVKGIFSMNAAVQHKFINNKLLLRASINDILNSYKINGTTIYKNYTSDVSQKRQTQTVNLSLTYNFNLGKSFTMHKVQKSSEEESKRL